MMSDYSYDQFDESVFAPLNNVDYLVDAEVFQSVAPPIGLGTAVYRSLAVLPAPGIDRESNLIARLDGGFKITQELQQPTQTKFPCPSKPYYVSSSHFSISEKTIFGVDSNERFLRLVDRENLFMEDSTEFDFSEFDQKDSMVREITLYLRILTLI